MWPEEHEVRAADGRALRVYAGGDPGRPRIILEAGLGASGCSWALVARRLAPFARVLAYDRAGYGGSAPDPGQQPFHPGSIRSRAGGSSVRESPRRPGASCCGTGAGFSAREPLRNSSSSCCGTRNGFRARELSPRSFTALAEDLLAVIRATAPAGGGDRVVLAGHSLGGPIVRLAAARLIAEGRPPAGLLLIDPSDERFSGWLTPALHRADEAQARLLPALARAGLLRHLTRLALAGLPAPDRDAVARATSTMSAARAMAAELRAVTDGIAALRADPPRLGALPVRIISGTRSTFPMRRMRAELRAAHLASAAACEDGAVIDAPRSSHLVPFSEPQLIADAALALARPAAQPGS